MRKWHLIILGVALAGAAAVALAWPKNRSAAPAVPRRQLTASAPLTYGSYQQRITALLVTVSKEDFYSVAGAQRLREFLLSMSLLPPEAQAPHLLLVLATDKVIAGKVEEAKVILEELGRQDWLKTSLKKYLE